MMLPLLQSLAEMSVGRILNTVPEGLLIASFVWALLRLLPRQNAGTRFAVWFLALVAVAGLPWLGNFAVRHSLLATGSQPLVTVNSSWVLAAFFAWLLAAGIAFLRLASGLWNLHQLRASCSPVDLAELDPEAIKTLAQFRDSRQVILAKSESVRVPAAFGFLKPMIVLPAWALSELPADELNIILVHELAHIQRRDDWTNLLQKTLRAVLFFHPAIWWIDRRLSLEREMACDDMVLAKTANPRGYAACLLSLLEKSFARRRWSMAQAAVDRTREAFLRVAQILDHKRPASTRIWKPAIAIVGAFSVIALALVVRAPELVAFHQRAATTDATASLARMTQPALSSSAVIPAALHIGELTEPQQPAFQQSVSQKPNRHTSHPTARNTEAIPFSIPAKAKVAPASVVPLVRASYKESAQDQAGAIPAPQMLIFVETTERVDSDSYVWSVRVWRLMVITPSQLRATQTPGAKAT
jgi:beta-lactamase regulating signal transducer with metallopeptidase domain